MTLVRGRDPATGGGLAVTLAGGRIATVAADPAVPADAPWIAPGLVDLQVNGWGGLDLNDGRLTAETVAHLVRALAATGVTTLLPTLLTASEESLCDALAAIAAARRADPAVARAIPGVHVEGPSISPDDGPRGAHPRGHVRPPDRDEFDRWQAAAGGLVRLVTLAPEWAEAPSFVRSLAADGVVVAIGHSAADPAAVRAVADAGARLSTHLGNGVAATLPRHPNLIWAQLADDRLSASVIADGHHLPDDTLKAMIRAKGIERSILVSDAVALAGMPPGLYDAAVGGRVELTAEGRLGVAGTPYLAGAARALKDGVATAVRAVGLGLADALRLATANPADLIGATDRGRIAPGAAADLIRFRFAPGDATLTVETVLAGGMEIRP
ncbi:MAG: N-acetylglucosamine-6-phosphate deacetylase [Rhodospirillales bacterium]